VADRLARELAALTATLLTDAVTNASLVQLEAERRSRRRRRSVLDLAAEFRQLPIVDDRTADEIIGYEKNGLPA
jgi:antitoxin VapB